MEFLDNAIVKTKEAFDVACKKTGEVVNTKKLEFDLASLRSKQDKDFSALGRICFDLYKNDENATDEVKALVSAIAEKNKKMAELNAAIVAAKNKRLCPKCSAPVEKNAVFCSNCGEKITFDDGEI